MDQHAHIKRKRLSAYTGLGQLTLVEHALCPLDATQSLQENQVHECEYFFTDTHRHTKKATAKIFTPAGLSAHDELYLWGLLALTFAQPDPDFEFHATPHYCLRQLGIINQHARRGGRQYEQIANAVARLAAVTYQNNHFWDPVRGEHRRVSFRFLSYSLPMDPDSARAWRIVWDPLFFELVKATGGHLHFDLATYRELDPASRRLFLLLSKIFCRRETTPAFDVTHLAVHGLGFSNTVPLKILKVKLLRCIEVLAEHAVLLPPPAPKRLFVKNSPGKYTLTLHRGPYFSNQAPNPTTPTKTDSPLREPLQKLGFEDSAINRLLREYSLPMLREWIDIALAAQERFGPKFFKRSAQAYLIDNLRNAKLGQRTPPDWWHAMRKEEQRPVKGRTARGPADLTRVDQNAVEKVLADVFRSASESLLSN